MIKKVHTPLLFDNLLTHVVSGVSLPNQPVGNGFTGCGSKWCVSGASALQVPIQ